MSRIKVVELFAGVGGFRIGLEGYPKKKDAEYDVIWSNQWEPSTKKQHASMVYRARWPECAHVNENIEEVIEKAFEIIPDHDMLVGGFPCQDYSVATSLRNSKGLRGKKGVLWWSIEAILRKKGAKRPKYLILENVDRLLKSPADQRGRDFAIMLRSLDDLGYVVEWRVINAADYGMPQRRRRTFIMAYLKGSDPYTDLVDTGPKDHLERTGIMAKTFPIEEGFSIQKGKIDKDLLKVSKNFGKGLAKSPFLESGVMKHGEYFTSSIAPRFDGKVIVLEEILQSIKEVREDFLIPRSKLKEWQYQKGAKRLERVSGNGHPYIFSEGRLTFPDPLDRPSRTIITGEGGPSPSRFKHVVEQEGVLRRLTPIELERLNMFPDDHTKLDGIRDAKRAFFMGNALVVGVVERLGKELAKRVH